MSGGEKSEVVNLSELRVKLLKDSYDVEAAEAALSRHHPLGVRKAMGRRLWYSVSYRGVWIAVLLFD